MKTIILFMISIMTLTITPASAYVTEGPPKQPSNFVDDPMLVIAAMKERIREAKLEQQYPEPAPVPAAEPTHTVWDSLAQCESNGEWDYGPHSGWGSGIFEGGLQFHPNTWDAYKSPNMPDAAYTASRSQQIEVAERVLDAQGWGAWPACSLELGLR